MKKFTLKRIFSFLLSLILLISFPGASVSADTWEWDIGNGEEVWGFLCDGCYEGFTEEEQEPLECSVCGDLSSYSYCDSCFCSDCERCSEHCVCSVDYPEFDPSESEIDSPTAVIPDFESAGEAASVDPKDIIVEHEKAEVYLSSYVIKGIFTSLPRNTLKAFALQTVTGKDNVDAAADFLKNSSEIVKNIEDYDTLNASTLLGLSQGKENTTLSFTYALQYSDEVKKVIRNDFDWESTHPSLDEKIAMIGDFVELLKREAIKEGYSKEEVDKISVSPDSPQFSGAYMAFDDGMLYINQSLVEKSDDGADIASIVAHEFSHAMNDIANHTLASGNEVDLKNASVSNVRTYIGEKYYTAPNLNSGDFSALTRGLIAYGAQLEERTVMQTQNAVLHLSGENSKYLFEQMMEKYGYEVLPATMEFMNRQNYGSRSQNYLNILASVLPELNMISSDILFDELPLAKAGYGYRVYSDNGENNDDLLFRFKDEDGTVYILPTRELVLYVQEKTGVDLNKALDPMFQMLLKDAEKKSEEKAVPTEKTTEKADYYGLTAEGFLTMEAIGILINLGKNASEEDRAALEAGFQKIDELSEILSNYESTQEDLENELENVEILAEDIESLQDELEDMISEYESMVDDLEMMEEEALSELENIADELNAEVEELKDNPPDDLGSSDIEDILDEIRSAYEDEVSAINDELAAAAEEIEDLAADIESLSEEIEAAAEELENSCALIDDLSDDLERMEKSAEEFAELLELIDRYSLNEDDDDGQMEYERYVRVTVTDSQGKWLSDVPIYMSEEGGEWIRFLGRTNEKGKLDVRVNVTALDGIIISAGRSETVSLLAQRKSLKDGTLTLNGETYQATDSDPLIFMAEMEDGEPVFTLTADLVLSKGKTGEGRPQAARHGTTRYVTEDGKTIKDPEGSVRITIRYNPGLNYVRTTEAGLLDNKRDSEGKLEKEVLTWKEAFEYEFYGENLYRDVTGGRVRSAWNQVLTEETAAYYGAYLIPLSESGDLPSTDDRRFFAPLYQWVDGKPAFKLVESSDFGFESYAFRINEVPEGRYELCVILPEKRVHFEEVTVLSEGATCVNVCSWNTTALSSEKKNTRLREATFEPEIYDLYGEQIGTLDDGSTDFIKNTYGEGSRKEKLSVLSYQGKPVFALTVDPSGKTVWSIVQRNESGKPMVFSRSVFRNSGFDPEFIGADTTDFAAGQLYLITSDTDIHILPVNLQFTYKAYLRNVRSDDGSMTPAHTFISAKGGKIYALKAGTAISGTEATSLGKTYSEVTVHYRKPSKRLYVAFWEQVVNEDGSIGYQVFSGKVKYELHYALDEEEEENTDEAPVMKAWMLSENVRLADANPEDLQGNTTHELTRKDQTSKGVVYTFENYSKGEAVGDGAAFDEIPISEEAEEVILSGTSKIADDPTALLSGSAWATIRVTDENGNKVRQEVKVEPRILETPDGVCLRFIFGGDCENGHDWEILSNTATCTEAGTVTKRCYHCGETVSETVEALGHSPAHCEENEKYYISEDMHGDYCLRCHENINVVPHSFELKETTENCVLRSYTQMCKDCGKMKITEEKINTHVWDEWKIFSEEEHYHCCTKCGTVEREAHQLTLNNRGYYSCSICGTRKGYDLTLSTQVCCQHTELTAIYSNMSASVQNDIKQGLFQKTWSVNGTVVSKNTDRFIPSKDKVSVDSYPAVISFLLESEEDEYSTSAYLRGGTYVKEIPATCEKDGMKAHYVCLCGKNTDKDGNEADFRIPALGHSYSSPCDTTCDRCGATREVTHTPGKYEAFGSAHHRVCTVCGKYLEEALCTAGPWIIDKEASCTETGHRHRACTVCGNVMVEEEIPFGHRYTPWETKEATCSEPSEMRRQCTLCGREEIVCGTVLQHQLVHAEGSPVYSSDKEAGHYTCTVCGSHYEDINAEYEVREEDLLKPESEEDKEAGTDEKVKEPSESSEDSEDTDDPEKKEKKRNLLWLWILLTLILCALLAGLYLYLKKKRGEEKAPDSSDSQEE